MIAKETGRSDKSVKDWTNLVHQFQGLDSKFEEWVEDAGERMLDGWKRKLIAPSRNIDTPPPPEGTFRVWYADPPWEYSSPQHSKEEQATTLITHYDSMPTMAICEMPVAEHTTDSAVLFLWTTSPKLYEAEEVLSAWGFTYKASMIWNKLKHNVGHYVSVRHEFLLICTKGSCLPDSNRLIPSVQDIERTEHSVKPERFREIIDEMYIPPEDGVDRIEMFARGDLPVHWAKWKHE